jgi:plastocyanin
MVSMSKGLVTLLVIIVLGVAGFVLFWPTDPQDETPESNQTDTTQSQPQTTPETDDEDQAQADGQEATNRTVNVDMSDHRFSVEEIRAVPGETVTVVLTNGQGIHDFVIDELDVDSGELAAGQSREVTFTIPEDAGGETYAFYCSVSNHRALGMEGELIIANR